ncbi:hypothetical protein NEUTE1DRAFT_139129 [Neurospora tetrasperma FGSC 2508]|uniref:Uncharacterized protein n=1 Tax=Neurospora tetrasperma (strain FGSC 2508 / ATCC MYA-4615 / P0657) TaxID=510951 RepID=F8MP69_NEUT8|nr:uncharacterized protein NEUTE1DRAFT_139129 [Neurospora tetrasperma FGSC 2508]EGO57081.1 hypothetical protein NEUTE1DRAFT_139129 [Neurospora tetrasperma FGSC 2508]EGZ70007.1 hypothetical protein NEUTE2DRAFT_69676 [Neurospora tetrasperma FGSC 2509]
MAVSLSSSLGTPHAKYSAIAKLPNQDRHVEKKTVSVGSNGDLPSLLHFLPYFSAVFLFGARELPFMFGAWCLSPGLAGMPITNYFKTLVYELLIMPFALRGDSGA